METAQAPQVEPTIGNRIGELDEVARFLPCQAQRAELCWPEGPDALGCQSANPVLEPVERSPRGGERDLLLEDDPDQSRKARPASPERGGP